MTAGRLGRRRFLAICAAALVVRPEAAQATRWRGHALGAVAEITLRGPEKQAARALRAARATLRRMERLFSLYDPQSDLARLNRIGRLARPEPEFLALLRLCGEVHDATGGHFDPTVQPLWQAMSRHRGAPDAAVLRAALSRVGWPGVAFDRQAVRFARPEMAMTFNGIAQGFATDRVAETLAAYGFAETLVNIGEFRAGEGSWRVGVEDPRYGLVATRRLARSAIATSSPSALPFGDSGLGHIVNPTRALAPPIWSTVSVEAGTAARADGYSTALCLLDRSGVEAVTARVSGLDRVLLIGEDGERFELA